MIDPTPKSKNVFRVNRRKFLVLLMAVAGQVACRQLSKPIAGQPSNVLNSAKSTPTAEPTPTLSPTRTRVPAEDDSASYTEIDETRIQTEVSTRPEPPATETPATVQPEPDISQDPTPEAEPPPTTPAHNPLLIVDAHQDIAWNWLEFGRDPSDDALDGRKQEAGTQVPWTMGQRTTGLPQWLTGRIGIIFSTIFIMPAHHAYRGWGSQTYVTAEDAHAKAVDQLEAYKDFAAHNPNVQLIESKPNLDHVINSWMTLDDPQANIVGLVLLMEGADPIREPREVRDWYERGLRIIGPAWKSTRYSGGTGEPGPLTTLGWELLEVMAEVNMILDLSHMAEVAYLEAIENYQGPLIASHSNPRKFLPTDRGLSDKMIRLLAGREGVVGIMPYNRYLKLGWETGDPRSGVTIQTVVDAIDHVVQLTGSSEYVGIGSDFDGGFGLASIPSEMDTVADLIKIADGLDSRGYSAKDIELIMNGNWVRVLRNSLPNAL